MFSYGRILISGIMCFYFSVSQVDNIASSPATLSNLPVLSIPAVHVPATYPRRAIRRRPRTVYSPEQMQVLEMAFTINQYPDIYEREALADALVMAETRVQVRIMHSIARIPFC